MADMGRSREPNDRYDMMTLNHGLLGFVSSMGCDVSLSHLAEIERDLLDEIASVRLFDDAWPTINEIRAVGLKVAVCSNLAAPYGVPVKLLLPDLDAYALSYEVGFVKPSPEIYQLCTQLLGASAQSCLFVGDSYVADVEGPRAVGMSSVLIDRTGLSDRKEGLCTLRQVLTLVSSSRKEF